MSINKKWKRVGSDLCPLCHRESETVMHLLPCTQQDISNVRTTALKKLQLNLTKLDTSPAIRKHWNTIFSDIVSGTLVTRPGVTMNPTTWTISAAIGWNGFMNALWTKRWSAIQQKFYEGNLNDGENIHSWQRMVMRYFMDFLRELWAARCGYIHAETILTSHQILRQRTRNLDDDNVNRLDLLPVLDRHLLHKKERYFRTSSTETLEIWEKKLKKALKEINTVPKNQPILTTFLCPTIDDNTNTRVTRVQKRRSTYLHPDPVWNKRICLSLSKNDTLSDDHKLTRRRKGRNCKKGQHTNKRSRLDPSDVNSMNNFSCTNVVESNNSGRS